MVDMHAVTLNALRPPAERPEGKVVPQYGPEWQAHVASGGEVAHGNILVGVK